MTTELEERIRANLHRRADAVVVRVPEPDLHRPAHDRHRSRRLELVAIGVALLLFVGAGVVMALVGREDATPSFSDAPTQPLGPLGQALEPGVLVSMPEPWELDRFAFVSAAALERAAAETDARTFPDGEPADRPEQVGSLEYTFSDDGRTVQLNFYPLGQREPTITTPEPPVVGVRGTTGYFLDYGEGRYRIQWDEGGRTWEVDGDGWAGLDDLAVALDQLQVDDDATWAAWAPPELADAVLGNLDGSVGWQRDADPQLTIRPLLAGRACQPPQPTLVVFLDVHASTSEVDAVARLLDESSEVASFRFVDKEESKEEFDELFADSPEMLASVEAEDLPASFRVETVDGIPFDLIDRLATLLGIREILPNPCNEGGAFVQQGAERTQPS